MDIKHARNNEWSILFFPFFCALAVLKSIENINNDSFRMITYLVQMKTDVFHSLDSLEDERDLLSKRKRIS